MKKYDELEIRRIIDAFEGIKGRFRELIGRCQESGTPYAHIEEILTALDKQNEIFFAELGKTYHAKFNRTQGID